MSDVKSLVKAKKNYHHGDLRGQLLEAVRELVEKNGPDGFSIAEACRLAGVSTAAPYKHFSDRHDILRGVVVLGMERLRASMGVAAASYPAGDIARIVALGQAYITFAREEPGIFRIMFGFTEGHDDDPELTRMGDETNAFVDQLVADHQGRSAQEPDVKMRSYALWCFVHGHAFLHMDAKVPDGMTAQDETRLLELVGSSILRQPD